MPVTLTVVDHPARSWAGQSAKTAEEIFKATSHQQYRRSTGIIQSSFAKQGLDERHVTPCKNGFVWSAVHAYSTHHHLVVRPDDVWFAILTQLSFYINAHAEELRSLFVAHEGQQHLEVFEAGTINTVDFGTLAERMTHMIAKYVKDPELRTWVMPEFSTTSDSDRVVASILFMGAMQKYFSYGMSLTCGIPSITLLGQQSDWQMIFTRLDKLEQLGEEPTHFAKMLRPVLAYMILSFEQPTSPGVVNFWNKMLTDHVRGSGMDYLSGWLGAFCYWSAEGKANRVASNGFGLDGIAYPVVDLDNVPEGFASVPVRVNDNGMIHECTMLAGSLGIEALSFAQPSRGEHNRSQASDTIQPLSGWIMFENEDKKAAQSREDEIKALEGEADRVLKAGIGLNSLEARANWEKLSDVNGRLEELRSL
ncbi:DUF4419 domain [Paramyrothecium foliicola]|nr:DUF4419 domain [Paramyrothecium foliicola]